MGRNPRPVVVLALVCALIFTLLLFTLVRTDLPERPEPPTDATASTVEVRPEPETDGFTLCCPNLGKADAFLLQSAAGAVLIDTGEDPDSVLELLHAQKVTTLDALVLSHFDKDHIGGAAAVLRQFDVKTLYRTAFEEDSAPYDALTEALAASSTQVVTVTDTLTVSAAGAELTLYPPLRDSYEKDEDNNASLIASVEADGCALLFPGDALKPRIREFLEEQYDGTQYQLLKIPHHGGEVKPTALLLEVFTPQLALITSSTWEPESEKLTQRLEEEGVEVLLTREGTVTLRFANGKVEKIS